MHGEGQAYVDVYRVLDEICFRGMSPTGARGMLFAAIDHLRRQRAPAEHVETAEKISVALHRLEWGNLRRDQADCEEARKELQVLGATWQQTPIPQALN